MESVFDCNNRKIEVGDVGVEIETGRPIKWDGRSFVYQDDYDEHHPNINCAGGPGLAYYTNFTAAPRIGEITFVSPDALLRSKASGWGWLKKYLAQKF